MADKFSVLIKYKHLEYIKNARLNDADSWVIMNALIEYDKTGKEPVFINPVLTGLFAAIKYDLDENRGKWDEAIKAKSEAGKKGMEKRWGEKSQSITVDSKDNTDNTCYKNITEITPVTPVIENITEVTNITDSDLDSDSEFESGGGNIQPPLSLKIKIKNQIIQNGFFLDDDPAIERLVTETDPSWFDEPHGFIAFIAETVKDRYAKRKGKGKNDLHNLFRKLLFNAPNLREAYPQWRAEQEKQTQIATKSAAIAEARKNYPTKCDVCGNEITSYDGNYYCRACERICEFNLETLKWEWRKW